MKKNILPLCIGIGLLLLLVFNWDKVTAFAKGQKPAGGTGGNNDTGGDTGSTGGTPKYQPPAGGVNGVEPTPMNLNEVLSTNTPHNPPNGSVLFLQQLINKGWSPIDMNPIVEDGWFGTNTLNALMFITDGKYSSTTLSGFIGNYYSKSPNVQDKGTGGGVFGQWNVLDMIS